jgi:Cu-Zn family superoxide dismutase
MKKLALALLLAACGSSKTTVKKDDGTPPASAPASAPATSVGSSEAPPAEEPLHLAATIEARSGSKMSGTAEVVNGVLTIKISGATPGKHGVHLHETGDCTAADAASAGGHWNPDKMTHGAPGVDPHHAGDLGNLEVGADGNGTITVKLTRPAGDLAGKAVIVHAGEDDLKSQPAGNSGARAACGVLLAIP